MRPHLLASSASTASTIATRLTNPASNRSLTYLLKSQGPLALSANKRLFTNTAQRPNLVKPQANTTTSGQNVRIPSASTEATTTTTTPTAAMSTPISASVFLEHVKKRRTYYQLNKELTISKDRFEEIVKEGLHQIPSSFDSQSNRVLVLFGAEHDKFWDITAEVLKDIVPADSWANTEARLAGFKAAAASVGFCPPSSPFPGQAQRESQQDALNERQDHVENTQQKANCTQPPSHRCSSSRTRKS